jgi:hypothetical protein
MEVRLGGCGSFWPANEWPEPGPGPRATRVALPSAWRCWPYLDVDVDVDVDVGVGVGGLGLGLGSVLGPWWERTRVGSETRRVRVSDGMAVVLPLLYEGGDEAEYGDGDGTGSLSRRGRFAAGSPSMTGSSSRAGCEEKTGLARLVVYLCSFIKRKKRKNMKKK